MGQIGTELVPIRTVFGPKSLFRYGFREIWGMVIFFGEGKVNEQKTDNGREVGDQEPAQKVAPSTNKDPNHQTRRQIVGDFITRNRVVLFLALLLLVIAARIWTFNVSLVSPNLPPNASAEATALTAQLQQAQTYQDQLLQTVYWTLGGILTLGLALMGFSWFTNIRMNDREIERLKSELTAEAESQRKVLNIRFQALLARQDVDAWLSTLHLGISQTNRFAEAGAWNDAFKAARIMTKQMMNLPKGADSEKLTSWPLQEILNMLAVTFDSAVPEDLDDELYDALIGDLRQIREMHLLDDNLARGLDALIDVSESSKHAGN